MFGGVDRGAESRLHTATATFTLATTATAAATTAAAAAATATATTTAAAAASGGGAEGGTVVRISVGMTGVCTAVSVLTTTVILPA